MTDPIADMLTRIRNAYAIRKSEVILPMSKFKYNLAKLLVEEGWLSKIDTVSKAKDKSRNFDQLKIVLKYSKSGKPSISYLKKISRPGRRIYCDYQNLPRVLNGFGIAIISTSKGLKTDKQARKEKVGGEVLCEIY